MLAIDEGRAIKESRCLISELRETKHLHLQSDFKLLSAPIPPRSSILAQRCDDYNLRIPSESKGRSPYRIPPWCGADSGKKSH